MAPMSKLLTVITEWLHIFSISSVTVPEYGDQKHLGDVSSIRLPESEQMQQQPPSFTPPGSNIDNFYCNYTHMKGWRECHTKNQGCWLEEINGPGRLDITSDYENDGPIGIDRYYTLFVSDKSINADGLNFAPGKVINGTLPGPLLEACWGDRLHITVVNNMKFNGTSIHWHGIRQLNNTPMDGVNGITQCPIPPGSNFTYVWNATQYGSSWLHSHYSVQYADGVQAPITIHGPASKNYTDAVEPLIMTDWAHNSAFAQLYVSKQVPGILLNGIGNSTRYNSFHPGNESEMRPTYSMNFSSHLTPEGRRPSYLLRVINTAFDTGFVFTIDHHDFWVVEADFVPVEPFKVKSILVAIGQRYMIVVDAQPETEVKDGNYWVRTYAASGCQGLKFRGMDGYERMGILRYPDQPGSTMDDPTTNPWPNLDLGCREENERLHPVVKWTVPPPQKGLLDRQRFHVYNNINGGEMQYGTAFFSLQRPKPPNDLNMTPFQTDYSNPTFLQLDSQINHWPIGSLVISEGHTANDWAYILLQGDSSTGPHPIHLHGHDFAILQTSYDPFTSESQLDLKHDNPPRRDVVYVPNNGFVVIAFKTDNPGTWLIHCHIAGHASGGLAMQILERQGAANVLWPRGSSEAVRDAQELCLAWQDWVYDCRNYWPGKTGDGAYPACANAQMLSVDSGV